MKKIAATALALAALTGAAQAQKIGVAATGHLMTHEDFRTGLGAGVWLTVPLGQSRWSVGTAASFTQAENRYGGCSDFICTEIAYSNYTNRSYSASLIIPRQLLEHERFGIALGPSLGYSSIGAQPVTVMADRIFAGLWANCSYKLGGNIGVELVLHPRWSPVGNGGTLDAPDPFSGRSLGMAEGWLGLSYTFGKAEK